MRATANLSTGGTAIDRTNEIHPDNVEIARRAALIVGLDVCGVDFVCPDIGRSVRETGGGVIEVNAAPGLRMHLEPSEGAPRDVAKPIIEMLFPRGRLVADPDHRHHRHQRQVDRRADGQAYPALHRLHGRPDLDQRRLYQRHPHSRRRRHRAAKRADDPSRSRRSRWRCWRRRAAACFARGSPSSEADIAACLNVTADHLGLKGIETVEDLASVKSVVVEAVRRGGHSVLNADDPLTVRMAPPRRAAG